MFQKESCLAFSKRWYVFISRKHVTSQKIIFGSLVNHLKPNDPYRGRTAPLNSKVFILYIYSTNVGTEYFKPDIYSPFFPIQNAVCFIIITYLVPVLFTFLYSVC